MMVMTTKVDMKKILIVLAAVVGVIVGLVLLMQGGDESTPTATASLSNNDARVQFLKGFGWAVSSSPTESGQVRIPKENTEVYERYNALQKSQGYDLSQYAGKTVTRYVYKVTNYPGATEPVYATLLVYKNKVIGGDITDTGAKGVIQGFKKQAQTADPTDTATVPSAETTLPTETTAPPSK